MKPFSRLWEKLQLTDEDMHMVQLAIISNPKGWPVIPGTGGLRKMRFSSSDSSSGKRDSMRLCYTYFEKHNRVFLVLVYPKNQKDDLTADEKKAIRSALREIEKELDTP